jgi:type I restriction-modification system DNA methylase subunit
MDKESIKNFINWLEYANDEELRVKREEIMLAFQKVSSKEGRADINLAMRLYDEEIISRLALTSKKHG